MSEFTIASRHPVTTDGSTEISVVGPITHTTTPAMRDYLRRVIEAGPSPRLRLDMSSCTSINVDSMLALSVAQHAARSRGGELRLVDVPLPIARQLRQQNLNDLLLDPTSDQR